MSDEETSFILSENRLLAVLRTLEDLEFASHNAKGHVYERRWARARIYLLAISKMAKDCLSNIEALDSYDKSQPPSQT